MGYYERLQYIITDVRAQHPEGVRFGHVWACPVLCDMIVCTIRARGTADEERKRRVRTEKIVAAVPHEAHQPAWVGEATEVLPEGQERFYVALSGRA